MIDIHGTPLIYVNFKMKLHTAYLLCFIYVANIYIYIYINPRVLELKAKKLSYNRENC